MDSSRFIDENLAKDILEEFESERRWVATGFGEKANVESLMRFKCVREIERFVEVVEQEKSFEYSEEEYQRERQKLQTDFDAKDNHQPDGYVEAEDVYLIPDSHHVSDCSNCSGSAKVDCSRCDTTGRIMCPRCDGQGEIRVREACVKCDGSGTVGDSADCPRCGGDGDEITSKACPRCFKDQVIVCPKCEGEGEHACPRCRGEGDTHKLRILHRKYTPVESVTYPDCPIPTSWVHDIPGEHRETLEFNRQDDKILHEVEKREIDVIKIEYKFPRRIFGESDTTWELYKIENQFRCENYPSRLNPLY